MTDDDYGRWGLGAAVVCLAMLVYMATCSSARAAPYEVRYLNPAPSRPYDVLAVCRASGCVEQPVSCAPGATSTAATVEIGGTFEVSGAGTIIPNLALTTAIGTAILELGSYFCVERIGSTTMTNVGQWD